MPTILSMISFGISIAASVRVGHAVGRHDPSGVKRAGLAPILLGVVIAAILTLAMIAAHFEIAGLFLNESQDDAEATIGLAGKLLLIGASFFITDGAQLIATGSLRGMGAAPLHWDRLPADWLLSQLPAWFEDGTAHRWYLDRPVNRDHVSRFQILANRRVHHNLILNKARCPLQIEAAVRSSSRGQSHSCDFQRPGKKCSAFNTFHVDYRH
ncbi:MATE family efflux transporter [Bradyrhizobium sp. CCBAU 11434]|uniref:MATE family efflux transporter n=1 Tax=Bradyrhizobium sp. CCBAU 11434 TaxID=1630885 RepID=UPI002FE197C2